MLVLVLAAALGLNVLVQSVSVPVQSHLQRHKRAAEFEEAAEESEQPQDEEGQPPATGLRRWVIRIRNIMFGRRDLEQGAEDGEAEGQPEEGRTWMESLAQWFAHGIKRILIRFGSAEGEGEEEGQQPPADAEAVPTPTERPAPPPPPPPAQTRRPRVRVPTPPPPPPATSTTTATPQPWTALPPVSVPSRAPISAPSPSSTAPGTVFDDDAFDAVRPRIPDHVLEAGAAGGGRPAPTPPVDETNELN